MKQEPKGYECPCCSKETFIIVAQFNVYPDERITVYQCINSDCGHTQS